MMAPETAGMGSAPHAMSSTSYSTSWFVEVCALSSPGVDPGQRAVPDRRSEPPRELGELEAHGRLRLERQRDGERAVGEVLVGREKLDLDEIGGQLVQCDRRFESSDAASGDENVGRTALHSRLHGSTSRSSFRSAFASAGKASIRIAGFYRGRSRITPRRTSVAGKPQTRPTGPR
jgi:hypothetical protein